MHLNITTIDLDLCKKLNKTKGTVGLVHSIYSSVINISFQDSSKIFSIAVSNVIQSPYMMRTDDIKSFMNLTNLIEVGETVNLIKTNQLRIGLFIIDWSVSSTWDKKLQIKSVNTEYINHRMNELNKYFENIEGNNQLVNALFDKKLEKNNFFQQEYEKIIADLNDSVTAQKMYKIIGLGIGLTPSGDDFFLGCFSVLYVHKKSLAEEIMDSSYFSLDNISSRTTQVGFNMIMHSFKGKVNNELYNLIMLDELSEKSIKNLQKIGSTSGEDMLAGVYFGYNLLMNNYKEEKI